jgi:OmpA-OmpF porin, OOP family
MCNWKNWIWPGIISTAVLTAVTGWFLSNPVEQDLTSRAGDALKSAMPWATIGFDGRDATVSGIAENNTLQSDAAKMALGTYGVRVVNNVTTLPQVASPFVLNVNKSANGVTLTGNYDSSESRAKIMSVAEIAMPGIAITDQMTLATGKPAGFDELAAFAVGQVADLTEGEASVSNTDYTIKGSPADVATYESVLAETAQLPAGGALKAADLSIPTLGRPYEFATAIDGDAVNMTGYAPSQDVKALLEADVKAAFPDKAVNNLLKLAAGAPSNFGDLVKFGLGQIKTLGNGSFSLADANYSVKGTPANAEVFEMLSKQSSENLPEGAALAMADLVKPAEPEPAPAPEPAPVAAPYAWSATSAAEGLKIEGTSPAAEIAQAAVDLAKRRFVKTEVTDGQTVLDGAPAGFAEAQANSLKALSYLTNGKASIVDKMLTIDGTAPSEPVSKLVSSIAQSGLPTDFQLVTNINIVAPADTPAAVVEPAKPYVWSATSNKDSVKLEGSVLSGDVGASILGVATSSFAGKAISNTQVPLNPSPAGFAAAQAASLQGLAQLREGAVSIVDKVVTLTGISASEDAKVAAKDMIGKALPDGYKLVTDGVSIAVAAPAVEPVAAPEPPAKPVAVKVDCLAQVAGFLQAEQISFARNKAEILESSKPLIGNIAASLAACPDVRAEIAGHTDSDGSDAYNLNLSQNRADAVRGALIAAGVPMAQLIAKGYGEKEPIAANDTIENKAKNRRTEFRPVQ